MKVEYRHQTPFPPQECCDRLRHAFANQATVEIAPGWLHAPHLICGKIGIDRLELRHLTRFFFTPCLTAAIVPGGGASVIEGEFRQGAGATFLLRVWRTLTGLVLLGMPGFLVLGVWRDKTASFTPGLFGVIFLSIALWIGSLVFFKRLGRITPEDMWVVKEFIERATHPNRQAAIPPTDAPT